MRHLFVAAAIAAITLAGMFVFPGHTWLQADTQIYMPMFERLWDPSLYQNELITSRPHMAWTIYDETALALKAVTHLDFEWVLLLEQILFRALGTWGVYLIGRRFTRSPAAALLIAGIFSLGATIVGPSVLTVEYEPVPRGFAVSLLICAIGLEIHGETIWASTVASVAFLYHAPTTWPYWIIAGIVILRTREWRALIPPVAAAGLLALFAYLQPGVVEAQPFWGRIDPAIEQLQRLRASYNWVSTWPAENFIHYGIVWAMGLAAYARIRSGMDATARLFFVGLPIIGMLSMPASYVLLEQMKWALIPQLQPARAVLLVTACAVILTSLAGTEAAGRGRVAEGFGWFLLPFVIPIHRVVTQAYSVTEIALVTGLALCAAFSISLVRDRWQGLAVAAALAVSAVAIPYVGHVRNYAQIHSQDLDDLSSWARNATPKDAVFVFPGAGRALYPGVFRVKALRSVYVDWKAGGQVNYFAKLGLEWWRRWQEVMVRHEIPAGANYVVYRTADAPAGVAAEYRNAAYVCVRRAYFR